MKKKTDIRAWELVRRIRDEQAAQLDGKSTDEIIDFFRKAGDEAKLKGARITSRGDGPPAEGDGDKPHA
jgi:hypothetical protein